MNYTNSLHVGISVRSIQTSRLLIRVYDLYLLDFYIPFQIPVSR